MSHKPIFSHTQLHLALKIALFLFQAHYKHILLILKQPGLNLTLQMGSRHRGEAACLNRAEGESVTLVQHLHPSAGPRPLPLLRDQAVELLWLCSVNANRIIRHTGLYSLQADTSFKHYKQNLLCNESGWSGIKEKWHLSREGFQLTGVRDLSFYRWSLKLSSKEHSWASS